MKEIYKDIEGYEGIYQVSNFGNVKSLERFVSNGVGLRKVRGRFLAGSISSRYRRVCLSRDSALKNYSVHQLVAMTFLNHKPCGMELVVNHIDFNKLNNHVSNLEIVTTRENSNKKHLKSSSKYTGVHWCKKNKKWRARIYLNEKSNYLGLFNTEVEASNEYERVLSGGKIKEIITSSKYKGVSWNKGRQRWVARKMTNGKRKHLGDFTDELEASKAYQKALKELNK